MKFLPCLAVLIFPVALFAGPSTQGLGSADLGPTEITPAEWVEVQKTFEASLYHAQPTPGGYAAFNYGQGWSIDFDGIGVNVQPRGEAWTWGLELQSYGFDGHLQTVGEQACLSTEGQRVTYGWDNNLEEWYINDSRGLEHGYTIQARPDRDGAGPLTISLAVRGGLEPQIQGGAQGIAFVDSAGAATLNYSGLHVFDANDVAQAAHFALQDGAIQIVIEEGQACYPLTVDPLLNQAYLKASNPDASDSFGRAVAAWGDLVVVGALREDSHSAGVNGDGSSNSLIFAGAAYIFRRTAQGWVQEAYLKASNPDSIDFFGVSVAVHGERVAIGAPGEASSATGIDGDQQSNSEAVSGAVYLFERVGGIWTQVAYVKASNTDADDRFGHSVALDSDRLAVGAPQEKSTSPGINGDESINAGSTSKYGAVYVFDLLGGVWTQTAYVKNSEPAAVDEFGTSVGLSGNRLVVGAPGDDSMATGINGPRNAGSSLWESGAAYIFEWTAGVWSQTAYVKPHNTDWNDQFGAAVAISGDRVLIGAPHESGSNTGINRPNDNSAFESGAAYLFEPFNNTWRQEAYIKAHNTYRGDWFGISVSASANYLLVGAPNENRVAPDGGNSTPNSLRSGAGYLFEMAGANWSQVRYLKARNADSDDWFGVSVAVTDERTVIGAFGESSSSSGINGDALDNSSFYAGAVYADSHVLGSEYYCGAAATNSIGLPAAIWVSGSAFVVDNRFYVGASLVPPGSFAYFLSSRGQDYVPLIAGSQGHLCLGGGQAIARHRETLQISPGTQFVFGWIDLTAMPTATGTMAVTPGETWNFQCWYRDLNPGPTSNFSNAIAVLFE